MQLQELVQLHRTAELSYINLAAISVDAPEVQAAFKHGLGARFTFLSDRELALTDALDIRETTDRKHGPLPVPFTFSLLPDGTIRHIFNGWYMTGRPTPEELRQVLRELLQETREDYDFAGE